MQAPTKTLSWLWRNHLGSLQVLSAMVSMPGHMMDRHGGGALLRNRFTDALEETGCVHWRDGVTPLGRAVIEEKRRREAQ